MKPTESTKPRQQQQQRQKTVTMATPARGLTKNNDSNGNEEATMTPSRTASLKKKSSAPRSDGTDGGTSDGAHLQTPKGLIVFLALLVLLAVETLRMGKQPGFQSTSSLTAFTEVVAVPSKETSVASTTIARNGTNTNSSTPKSIKKRKVKGTKGATTNKNNNKNKKKQLDYKTAREGKNAMSLDELTVNSLTIDQDEQECKKQQHFQFIRNQVVPVNPHQRIPNIIHQTTKSRCLNAGTAIMSEPWRQVGNYSYYLHDDAAMFRLLQDREWPEFPLLQAGIMRCIKSMTAISDVWRYLVLWEYGGIYSDLDSIPNHWSADSIRKDDDAYFVVEFYDALSQYWMALSPKHPLMYYAVNHALLRALPHEEHTRLDAAMITGPFALLEAFSWFMWDVHVEAGKPVKAGVYKGRYGRSIRVVGKGRDMSSNIILREAMRREEKIEMYHKMNMTHFLEDKKKAKKDQSGRPCYSLFYDALKEGHPDWMSPDPSVFQ